MSETASIIDRLHDVLEGNDGLADRVEAAVKKQNSTPSPTAQ